MPVVAPTPTRPAADPDWERWEAELEERRVHDPRDPGPPTPPEPPHDDDRPGRGGDDDGRRGRRGLLGLFVLLGGGLGLMAAVAFAASHQGPNHRQPITYPVPPVAASEPPETWRVQLNIPPSRQGETPRVTAQPR